VDSGCGARCNGRPKGRPYERVGGRIGFAAGHVGDDDLLGRIVPVAVVVEAGGVGAGGGHDGGGSGSDVAGLFGYVIVLLGSLRGLVVPFVHMKGRELAARLQSRAECSAMGVFR